MTAPASYRDPQFDRVYADTLRFFPELVQELGGDPKQLMVELGLASPGVSDEQPAGYRSIAMLMEHAAKRLACPDFGLRLAMRQGGGSVFGAMGAVMRHATTVGAGLEYVADHCHAHSLAARMYMKPVPSNQSVIVGHDILVDGLPLKRQLLEQLFLLAQLNALEISGGKARVREVLFRFQPLSSLSTYQRYFGCRVRFDQPLDGVIFSEADLQRPTLESDAELFTSATRFVESNHPHTEPPMHARVRALILQWMEDADCSKERVASALGIHPRTLHRRLTDEGTCFHEIKDAARRDVALGYLEGTELRGQRIAEKLGYAEHSVLTRSCSRWFAASPRELRRRRGNESDAAAVVPKCRDARGPVEDARSSAYQSKRGIDT